MKTVTAFLACCFAATTAFAQLPTQWTPAEKAELQKVGRLRGDLSAARVILADIVRDNSTEANRAAVSAALGEELDAEHECFQAIRHIFNIAPSNGGNGALPEIQPPFGAATREQLVTAGVNYARTCAARANVAADRMLALTAPPSPTANQLNNIQRIQGAGNQIKLTLSVTNVANFQALPFTEWRPADYPRIVGPHGDYSTAAKNLAVADFRMLRATRAAAEIYQRDPSWPEWNAPQDCGGELSAFGFRELLRYGGSYSLLLSRALMIESGAPSATDESVILADAAASSGMRPPSFFSVLRVEELNSNPDGTGIFQNFRGRNLESGANAQFEVILDGHSLMTSGYIRYMNCLADAGTITQEAALNRARAAFHLPAGPVQFPNIDTMGSGWLRQVELDFAFAWEGSQGYDHYALAFIHALAVPPCGPGTHAVNGICQPDASSGSLSCGTGTHQDGNQCVADPCPTCPPAVTCGAGTHLETLVCVADPPPACPSFVAELVLLDGKTGEARCVEQP